MGKYAVIRSDADFTLPIIDAIFDQFWEANEYKEELGEDGYSYFVLFRESGIEEFAAPNETLLHENDKIYFDTRGRYKPSEQLVAAHSAVRGSPQKVNFVRGFESIIEGNFEKVTYKNLETETEEWEAELDMLGTASETYKYITLLEKAPAYAPSLPTLTNFIQQRMSA